MIEQRLDHSVDVVVRHPLLAEIGRSPADQRRAELFARDLARWFVGWPRTELGVLARVVTVVARRELRGTRLLAKERPLVSVEAAARATVALWPLLRGPERSEPGDEEEEGSGADDNDAEGDGEEGEAGGEGEGEADAEEGDSEGATSGMQEGEGEVEGAGGSGEAKVGEDVGGVDDAAAMLNALGEEADDEELAALIEAMTEKMANRSAEEAAADLVQSAANAAAEGAMETDQLARQLEHFVPGVGWSTAPGAVERQLLDRLDELSALLDKLPALAKLADSLGRMEDATRQRGKMDGGREEVVGVRLSGDISGALPMELALLGDEDTEDLFYQRLLEKRLVTLELAGSGDEGVGRGTRKGPVIACVDTSASMEGAPELAAKALVLALCRRILPRGRAMHLMLFGGPTDRTEVQLRRGHGGLGALLDFLMLSFHSGTDFDGPLLRAVELLEEKVLDHADIVVITDGLGRAAPHVVKRIREAKERTGVRIWSVVLGRPDIRGVAPFSDHVLKLDPEHPEQAAEMLQAVPKGTDPGSTQ